MVQAIASETDAETDTWSVPCVQHRGTPLPPTDTSAPGPCPSQSRGRTNHATPRRLGGSRPPLQRSGDVAKSISDPGRTRAEREAFPSCEICGAVVRRQLMRLHHAWHDDIAGAETRMHSTSPSSRRPTCNREKVRRATNRSAACPDHCHHSPTRTLMLVMPVMVRHGRVRASNSTLSSGTSFPRDSLAPLLAGQHRDRRGDGLLRYRVGSNCISVSPSRREVSTSRSSRAGPYVLTFGDGETASPLNPHRPVPRVRRAVHVDDHPAGR